MPPPMSSRCVGNEEALVDQPERAVGRQVFQRGPALGTPAGTLDSSLDGLESEICEASEESAPKARMYADCQRARATRTRSCRRLCCRDCAEDYLSDQCVWRGLTHEQTCQRTGRHHHTVSIKLVQQSIEESGVLAGFSAKFDLPT